MVIIVPFLQTEKSELRRCYNSDSPSDWFQGLKLIAAWQLRCSSTLPSFVYLTEMILRARMNYTIIEGNVSLPQWSKDENVKHFDSLVIIRFINVVYEAVQSRHQKLTTIRHRVAEFDIPEWIVELRHAATHSPLMPDLFVCRNAVEFLSNWLKERFWDKCNADTRPVAAALRQIEKKSLYVLKTYVKHKERQVITKKKEKKRKQNGEDVKGRRDATRLTKMSTKVATLMRKNADAFLLSFLNLLLLPNKMVRKWDLSSKYPPRPAQKLWRAVFTIVRRHGGMMRLLKVLFDAYIRSLRDHERIQIKAWIFFLLDNKWLKQHLNTAEFFLTLRQFAGSYPMERTDRDLLHRAVEFLTSGRSEKLESLTRLLNAKSLSIEEDMLDELIKRPTLEYAAASIQRQGQCVDEKALGPWRLDIENAGTWGNVPLGQIMGGRHSCTRLTLQRVSASQEPAPATAETVKN